MHRGEFEHMPVESDALARARLGEPDDLYVRQATAVDVESMLAVWSAAGEPAGEARRGELQRALAAAPDLLLVAEAAGAVRGLILATADGHRGYLRRLVVAPASRRRGVGRALVAEAERRLAARGLERLNLTVRADDAAARAFWAALGYRLEPVVTTWVKTIGGAGGGSDTDAPAT